MNVKRIVVDELPRDCSLCRLSRGSSISGKAGFCTAMYCPIKNVRKIPEWCPLELEEVCEWVGKWQSKDTKTYWKPHKKLSATLGISDAGRRHLERCPDCGKKIKYIEEN